MTLDLKYHVYILTQWLNMLELMSKTCHKWMEAKLLKIKLYSNVMKLLKPDDNHASSYM